MLGRFAMVVASPRQGNDHKLFRSGSVLPPMEFSTVEKNYPGHAAIDGGQATAVAHIITGRPIEGAVSKVKIGKSFSL
jgi:hypothetical protein